MKRIFLLLATVLWSACVSSPPRTLTDQEAGQRLWNALNHADASALPLAKDVLQDALEGSYFYSTATRERAFWLIRDLRPSNTAPLLRALASMEVSEEEGPARTTKISTIKDALRTLSVMEDSRAIELNRQRLASDAWLQSTAIQNLKILGAWEASSEISSLIKRTPPTLENQLVLALAVDFMAHSPLAEESLCPSVRELALEYSECFRPHPGWPCSLLKETVPALKERLRCSDTP